MGIASEEDQKGRGRIMGAFFIAILLAIPFLNMLAGAILFVMWGLKIISSSSNVGKDLLLFLGFFVVVGLTAFFGLDQVDGKNTNIVLVVLPAFLVAMFGSNYLLKNIDALNNN